MKAESFDSFMEIIRLLRSPGGCPWDKEQTHESLIPCMLEEAYEAVDAIKRNDTENLKEELGDVLLQVAMHAVIAEEKGEFTVTDVIRGSGEKMIRRHPHVFGNAQAETSGEVLKSWEEIKQKEHGEKTAGESLTKLPKALPAAIRAQKVQKKARKAGVGPGSTEDVWSMVYERLKELKEQTEQGKPSGLEETYGEFLFAAAALGLVLQLNAENSLTNATDKFINRFVSSERIAEDSTGPGPRDLQNRRRDILWKRMKQTEET